MKATLFLQESQHSVVQLLSPRCPFQPDFLMEASFRCKPKCSPSQPLFPTQEQPPDIPTLNTFICDPTNFSSSSQGESTITNDNIMLYNVVVKSSHKTLVTLPFNAILGQIRNMTPIDENTFEEAAKETAQNIANTETWYQSMSDNNTLFSMPSDTHLHKTSLSHRTETISKTYKIENQQ